MKQYATLTLLGGLVIFGLFVVLRALTLEESNGAESASYSVTPTPNEVRPLSADTQPADPPGAHSVDTAPAEAELTDGSVAREWGTFIEAKEIRVACRDVQHVVRAVPRPEDFSRRCRTKTVFDHPYALFTDAQLEQIAANDAAAAYLLAYRMLMHPHGIRSRNDLQQALSYTLNALVWTGEKQVFDLLIDGRHFQNRAVWDTVDGVPTAAEMNEKQEEYIWLKAGRNLDLVEQDDFRWTHVSGVVTRYQEYFDVGALDERAEALSDNIADRRSIVTGESR